MIRTRTALSLFVALGLAACSNDSTKPTPTVDRVVVTPDGSSVTALGATVQFEAEAQTSTGIPILGVSFEWASSDPSVASVDAAGLATAKAFGEASITASVDGVGASADFSVRDCNESVTLAVGDWASLPVPAEGDCGVIVPAGSDGDRYRVAVVSTTSDDSSTAAADVSVQVVPLGTSGGPSPRAAATRPALPSADRGLRDLRVPGLAEAARIAERTARAHAELRRREAALIRQLGPAGVIRRATAARSAPLPVDLPQTIQIDPTTPSGCTPAGTKVTATLIWQNDTFAFYQDEDQAQKPETAVTAAQVQRMASFYDDYGAPVIDQYFGGVDDIDGNGKVIVFISPVVESGTAAFVWSGDFFNATGAGGCAASNEGEYIYFSAPLIRSQNNLSGANWQSLETLVHEMKHVSSLYKSIQRPQSFADPYHPSWEEEGSAEIAGNLASRIGWAAVGGPAINARVTEQIIRDTGFDGDQGPIKPEFYGVVLRMFRAQGFLSSQPNGVIATPGGAGDDHSIYGSGWTFLRWLGDAYGRAGTAPMADADFFKTLNASATAPGIRGLEATTGKTFGKLMEEFAAAVMLHGTPAPQGPLAFTSYDFPTAIELFCFAADHPPCDGSDPGPTGRWPWPVTMLEDATPTRSLQAAATYAGRIGPAGLRIHDLVSDGTGTGAELVVRAPTQSRIVVVRTH